MSEENVYLKTNTNPNVSESRLAVGFDKFFRFLGIGSGYPKFEDSSRKVTVWFLEYKPDSFGPTRELGFDAESRLIVATPDADNSCILSESLEDIEINPDMFMQTAYISREKFEEIWKQRADLLASNKPFRF